MKTTKILSGVLAGILTMSMTCPVFAADITKSGETTKIPTLLSQEQTSFSVTVPTSLPVTVDAQGNVSTATDAKITNNSYGPIKISNISIVSQNSWVLADMNTDMSREKVGAPKIAFSINGKNANTEGAVEYTTTIGGNDSIAITYDAKIAPQKSALSGLPVANVIITLAWDETAGGSDAENPPPADPDSIYTLTGDDIIFDAENIIGIKKENLIAKGTTRVRIPSIVDGVTVGALDGDLDASSDENVWFGDTSVKYLEIEDGINEIYARICENSNIEIVRLGEGITTIHPGIFDYDTNLQTVYLPSTTELASGEAFRYVVPNLKAINVTPGGEYFSENGILYANGNDGKVLVRVPSGVNGHFNIPNDVVCIGPYAFAGCSDITSVKMPEGLKTISPRMFEDTGVNEISLPQSLSTIANVNCDDPFVYDSLKKLFLKEEQTLAILM